MYSKILMTTGYSFDGFSINKYIGVFSGECALGTGFLSSIGSDISDVLGRNSKSYASKLRQAKEYALEQLREQTVQAGGNAILGLSINYTMFSRDIIGVIANGTAVKIDATGHEQSNDKVVPILRYNKNTSFRPVTFSGHMTKNQYAFRIKLYNDSEESLTSILADIRISTVFEKIYELTEVAFTNFSLVNRKNWLSGYTTLSFPCEDISLLKNVTIITKKYIQNDVLVDMSNSDLEQELVSQEYRYADAPPMDELEELNSAKEIYIYLIDYMDKYDKNEPILMEWLKRSVELERIYGSMKKDAVKYVKEYYKLE